MLKNPYLIITIDTEEGFDWSKPFSRKNYITQTLFDHDFYMTGFYTAHNIRPISLVSYPILDDTDCQRLLKKYLNEKIYYLGTHLHSWVTPPFEEELSKFNSFAHNLTADLEFTKLKTLTEKFTEIVSSKPLFYKAGRYGISQRSYEFLEKLGYKYDFTPFAKRDFRHEFGCDFSNIDNKPYYPLDNKSIISYPATADYTGYFKNNLFLSKIFHNKLLSYFKIKGIFSRLNLFDFVPLTPEGVTENEMKLLTKSLIAGGQQYFHLSYHASSFTIKGNPYAKNKQEIKNIEEKIKNYIQFFQEIGGITSINLAEKKSHK